MLLIHSEIAGKPCWRWWDIVGVLHSWYWYSPYRGWCHKRSGKITRIKKDIDIDIDPAPIKGNVMMFLAKNDNRDVGSNANFADSAGFITFVLWCYSALVLWWSSAQVLQYVDALVRLEQCIVTIASLAQWSLNHRKSSLPMVDCLIKHRHRRNVTRHHFFD